MINDQPEVWGEIWKYPYRVRELCAKRDKKLKVDSMIYLQGVLYRWAKKALAKEFDMFSKDTIEDLAVGVVSKWYDTDR